MAPPTGSGGSPAPIDRPILEFLQDRLDTTPQVNRTQITDSEGHLELRVQLSNTYYPESIKEATFTVRWYTNDDFKIHYREVSTEGDWECRWDRHPNPHNSREHFHPPPDAVTPGDDASWPTHHHAVVRLILDRLEERIEDLWRE